MDNRISRQEAAKMLSLHVDEVSALCREHLTYHKDYSPHRGHGTLISIEGLNKLREVVYPKSEVFEEREDDELIEAQITMHLPPNPKIVHIIVPGVEGKQVCNMPPKYAKIHRHPGRRIWVRKVGEGVYQFAIKDWREEV